MNSLKYLSQETAYYYEDEESLRNFFDFYGEKFNCDYNFCANLSGKTPLQKITSLIKELVKRDLLITFFEVVQEEYSHFSLVKKKYSEYELIEILNRNFQTDEKILLKTYHDLCCLENKKTIYEIKIDNAEQLVNALCLPQKEETYSDIHKFVGLLGNQLELTIELKQNLTAWANNYINEYEILIEELNLKLQQKKQEIQEANSSLLVAISSSGATSYVVKAWFIKNIEQYRLSTLGNYNQQDYSDCRSLKIQNKDEITLDASLTKLPEIIRELIQKECQKNPSQIHIFLPYKLMNYPVENFTTYEDEDETIGEIYQVFIRCSERLEEKMSKYPKPRVREWCKYGELLKNNLQVSSHTIFLLGDSDNPKTLEKKIKQEKPIAVEITTVFKDKQPGELIWKSCVPLALWIRKELKSSDDELIDNQSELDQLLLNSCLQELPEKVKKKRLDAMDYEPPENHLGRNLCLLWDDPNLLPPTPLLTDNPLA